MEEAVKLICSGGGYGDLAVAEAEGKRVIAAKSSSAAPAPAAAINSGDDSGDGEADYHHHDDGGDSDYLPRNFTKYRSLAEIYQSTKPSEIIINTTAKRRQGKDNGKKLANRIIMGKKVAANGEEEGKKKAAAATGSSNFIEVESLEEVADMEEACTTRMSKFRSIRELYEITLNPAAVSDYS